jgi:hypothetical protein
VVAFKKEFPLDRLLWQVFFDLVHRPEELNDLWIVDHLQTFRLFAFILLTIHFWATFIGTYGEWLHLLAINTLTEDASTLEEISDLILS